MKVLVIGSGGREHALAWKCAQSALVDEVLVAPGNAGTAREHKVRNVAVQADDIEGLLALAKTEDPGLTIVGPEVPLVAGIVDRFDALGLPCFGPTAAAELSACFLRDLAAAIDAIPHEIGRRGFAVYAPAGAEPILRRLLPPEFGLFLQQGRHLGEALLGATRGLLAAGHGSVLLVNGDSPSLPSSSSSSFIAISPIDTGPSFMASAIRRRSLNRRAWSFIHPA